MTKIILVATEKPFAKKAIEEITKVVNGAGYRLKLLESYKGEPELLTAIADANALVVRSDLVTPAVIDAGKQLEIIVRAGAGFDNINLDAASKKGIVVMNTPGQNSNAVAELVFGMMLNIARKHYTGKSGMELRGKRIGIHAYGNVGVHVNRIARGFDMEVVAFDPFVSREKMSAEGVTPLDSVEEMYATCDYISLHLPKMNETLGLVNYELMARMKDHAVLVNTARKEVVDEASLLKMFAEKSGFAYASDIAPDCAQEIREKYAERSFFTAKKMGAQTAEANINAGIAAAEQIVGFFTNGDRTFQVNK